MEATGDECREGLREIPRRESEGAGGEESLRRGSSCSSPDQQRVICVLITGCDFLLFLNFSTICVSARWRVLVEECNVNVVRKKSKNLTSLFFWLQAVISRASKTDDRFNKQASSKIDLDEQA